MNPNDVPDTEPSGVPPAIGGALAMALVGLLAWGTRSPFLAPPLGATALLCFQLPMVPSSSPRNVTCGHAIGLLCGWLALWSTGALELPTTLSTLGLPNVVAVALALGSTMLLMNACKCVHPPAGASTLVVSLGLLKQPLDVAALCVGGMAVALIAFVFHRLRGVDYPFWAPRPVPAGKPAAPTRVRRT